MRYLLDTNITSELTRSRPNPNVQARLKYFAGELAIASVSWHEMLYGMQRMPVSRRQRAVIAQLEQIQQTMPILPYDAAAAQWHAEERSRLVAQGRTPPFADAQIAAIAITQNLTLVTRNVRDFRIFDGLTLENWFDDP